MSVKLRDLIRSVRACKTAAEERAVITKECALIRTAIKEEDDQFRNRNVAKLMYIHMLGYPTHFGQMECLKLVSASTFPEKRIGYLGLTLLLNEQAEVLPMVTNTLKLDLVNHNQYIQALSLITIGNLATQDMARDLISDVEKILKSNNAYLKKKATLATIRLLKKEPDLIEHITERIPQLLRDRSHGVLITTIQLMYDILEICPEYTEEFRKFVPTLVRLLRNFISMGYSPEHDVNGIADPFMQVKLLQLLQLLGRNNPDACEQMSDILAQVATNTESAKNVGNSILYECVRTIMSIEADSGLHTLAINILGRFLLNRDNNIRYVALQSLSKVVSEDNAAVQRHRSTIVDCLKDPDISIRHRALELVYQLVNPNNVESLTGELLNYLVVCQVEHKANLVSHIMSIVEQYSPSIKWRLNTLITMLSMAGNECEESVTNSCVLFFSQDDRYYTQIVHHIYRKLVEDTSQTGFLHVGVWCIGEYGASLLVPCAKNDNAIFDNMPPNGFPAVNEVELINNLSRFYKLYNADTATKALVLNALMKMTLHVSPSGKQLIQRILEPTRHSMNLELQQRSNEYNLLLSPAYDGIRSELLAKMPIMDEASLRKKREIVAARGGASSGGFDGDLMGDDTFTSMGTNTGSPVPPAKSVKTPTGPGVNENNLLDIFGDDSTPVASTGVAKGSSLLDDLSDMSMGPTPAAHNDIFGSSSNAASAPAAAPAVVDLFGDSTPLAPTPVAVSGGSGIMDLYSGSSVAPPAAPVVVVPQVMENVVVNAVDKNGLRVVMHCSKPDPTNPALTKMDCKFSNSTQMSFSSLVFQAAVPKYMKLEMFPPTSTTIAGHSVDAVSQELRVTNNMHKEKNIVLKLKFSYVVGGKTVEDLVSVSSFPAGY